jgi:3-methylfumaryl-CoA hydratase
VQTIMVVGATHMRQPGAGLFTGSVYHGDLSHQHLDYQAWIGKEETLRDEITAWPLAALSATLDQPAFAGDEVPALWHWLYFLTTKRASELAVEGHAERGVFLPPVDLPRRMWAGGRLEFFDALRVGDRAERLSRILDIREKQGRSGRLVFVVVRHEVATERGVALTEEHDIVYRDHGSPGGGGAEAPQVPGDAAWEREIMANDVLLFRYSALTFNAHRIHYDRRYAVETEHYPGLIVHGPLIATLLLELLRERMPGVGVRRFEFRAVSPLFDTEPFVVCGKPDGSLWARTRGGRLAMTAKAEVRR